MTISSRLRCCDVLFDNVGDNGLASVVPSLDKSESKRMVKIIFFYVVLFVGHLF